MERKVFEVKISSRGQMVIPKVLREKYNLREGSRVKVIAGDGEIIIKPLLEGPWVGLRGLMREEWRGLDLDELIEEAKRSLFKV